MIRGLTVGERALAEEAFADSLTLDTVRFLKSPPPFDRAFVAGRWFGRDWVVWPAGALPDDIGSAPLRTQATFIHELTHVWQAQQGVNLLTGKLKAGDRPSSYEYPVGMDCGWADLNIEQQAMVVEHRFRLSRGQPAPGDQAFYDRVCPIGRPLAAPVVDPISGTDTVTK
ncbi:hypothetical protein [Brevundimonas sp.]|uniref:hypothetical protein n=1 Tax=Brevundimonas sp. TaxID=1871086 RepID=UPI002FC7BE1C